MGYSDIESANVVGYNTLNTGNSWQMVGSVFKGVGDSGDGFVLGDLTGNFADEDQIQISYMDEDGYVQFNVYQYLTVDGYGMDEDGWYNEDFELANDTPISRGSAAWFITSSGDAAATTTAGEVAKGETVHPAFTEAWSMISSSYPVAFNPNGEGVTWNGLTEEDQIQVAYVDEDGYVQFNVYQYLTVDGYGMDEDGWYDEDFGLVESPIAEVGQGFWLILQNFEAVSLTETSPLAE